MVILTGLLFLPNFLSAKRANQEIMAQMILRQVSIALENYMTFNQTYPNTIDQLLTQNPPYLPQDYFHKEFSGYRFTAQLSPYTYSICAYPVDMKKGVRSFTIETGGLFYNN